MNRDLLCIVTFVLGVVAFLSALIYVEAGKQKVLNQKHRINELQGTKQSYIERLDDLETKNDRLESQLERCQMESI